MTTEETTKAILTRVEDDLKELRADVRTILTTLALKADMSTFSALEGRVRVLETADAEDRGGRRYRSSAPPWITAAIGVAALALSLFVLVRSLQGG